VSHLSPGMAPKTAPDLGFGLKNALSSAKFGVPTTKS
jgi:hypothetical protein